MAIKFQETNIDGLFKISPHIYKDNRGYIKKYFEKSSFVEKGLPDSFTENNTILSKYGVLRGLHYQLNPSQSKLLYVICGNIFLVVVDLRKDSETFGKPETFYLSEDNDIAVFIPENFAVGTLAMQENSLVAYHGAGEYKPERCSGIIWNDKTLNIPWPVEKINNSLVVSKKDRGFSTFEEFKQII